MSESFDPVKNGRFRKLSGHEKGDCLSPEHLPPTHIVLEPGVYEYTCPACGHKTIVNVNTYI